MNTLPQNLAGIYASLREKNRLHRAWIGFLLPILVGLSVLWGGGAVAQTPATVGGVKAEKKTDQKTVKSDEPTDIPAPAADDSEVRMGRENAEENDKQVKLITDPAIVERVNRIGQEIAAVANKYPIPAKWGSSQMKRFQYTFKVVDDKDVNAYSLPGGFIYVNKGLLDFTRSDDELAGVLAHEVAHAAHHHMVKLLREQSKIDRVLLPLKLLAMGLLITKPGTNASDAQNLLLATQLYAIAKINTYGVEAEKDADHMGIYLLTKTRYNPVGLYSFMTRLATLERNKILVDLGIFRTHPPGEERVEAAQSLLAELNIPILLSSVDPSLHATVTMVKGKTETETLAEIKFRDIVLCRVTADAGKTAEERGQMLAKRFTGLFDARLQPFEVRATPDQTRVLVRGQMFLTTADAVAQEKTIPQLAREMVDAILRINQSRQLSSGQ